ncbi:hypothetical protein QYE76_030121 [Lolium multiflorum]|uniref:CCHC-type domain-containing protein n=1 Tax=Lolium multiflorum TaxID=4521 RepID=A0AAD8QSR8_LOLMU|nr:hypothetical protein QYE76_030121 [Lolium multiflorum]
MKAAAPPEKPKGGPKPDSDCYHCNGKGHWKRNCPKYLADLKSGLVKKKKGPKTKVLGKIQKNHENSISPEDSRSRARPEEAQGLLTIGRRGRGGHPTPWGGPLGTLPTPAFAYKMPRDLNLRQIDETPENIQGAAAIAKLHSGTEVSRHRRDGELPQAISTAIFTAIAVPMMRRSSSPLGLRALL